MGYVIRNYGETRQIPFKAGFISIERDTAIETDDPEVVKALSGVPQVNISIQPGTIVTPPEPPQEEEEEDLDDDDDDDNDDDDGDNDDDNDDDDDDDDESEEEEESPDYASMTKRELLDLAKERNLELPDTILKADLITMLLKEPQTD